MDRLLTCIRDYELRPCSIGINRFWLVWLVEFFRVLLGSTVSGWFGWLSFFVFYWEETVFGWFGCSTFSTSSELG